MTSKKKTTIVYLVVAVMVSAALVAYSLWNKKHTDVQSSSAIKITAADLYQNFMADSVAANRHFGGDILDVTGIVSSISRNQQNNMLVLLNTASSGAFINCTMEQAAVQIQKGSKVTIKGICNGIGEGDAELGIPADVYMVRCYLAK